MRTRIKYWLARFSRLFMLGPLLLFQTGEQPLDNLAVFNNLAVTLSQQIIERLSPDSSAAILIRAPAQPPAGKWLIDNGMVKSLSQNGISKIYLDSHISTSSYIIEYQILALRVDYQRTDRSHVIGRQFKVSLAVRALEGDSGLVKFLQEFNEQYADSVKIHDVARLEHKDFPFTQGELPEPPGAKKYLEPLLVTTTTAGIIYLFFKLRSN